MEITFVIFFPFIVYSYPMQSVNAPEKAGEKALDISASEGIKSIMFIANLFSDKLYNRNVVTHKMFINKLFCTFSSRNENVAVVFDMIC